MLQVRSYKRQQEVHWRMDEWMDGLNNLNRCERVENLHIFQKKTFI